MASPGESAEERAARLFTEHVGGLAHDGPVELDALCAAHPELADELRSLRSDWLRFQTLFGRLAPGSSPSPDPDPDRDPERAPGEPAVDALVADVLERLSQHAPRQSRYRLVGEVARGGMGAIVQVWDEDLRRSLAMKVVLGADCSGDPGTSTPPDGRALHRFVEEARVTGQLEHPGVVPVHELGVDDDGRVYFTMRLVQGRDLREVFELAQAGAEGWSPTRALGVMLKVCEAVAYAHSKGVLHRDLKPANVMVGRFGEVYVMDWGLAKVIGSEELQDPRPARAGDPVELPGEPDTPAATRDGTVLGTPAYMAPEQARGELERVSRCSDVYSIGAMLYHLLAGRMPYAEPGEEPSGAETWRRVIAGPPAPLHVLAPRAPAELESICEKAMAREPADRYADTMALAEDLRAYLENRVVRAHRTGAVAELRKWVARNRALAASLGALILVALVGSLAFAIYQRGMRERLEAQATQLAVEKEKAETNEEIARDNEQQALAALRRAHGARLLNLAENTIEKDSDLALLLAVEGARREPGHAANVLLDRCLQAAGLAAKYELHVGPVDRLAFTPDGRRLLSAGRDGRVGVWDAERAELSSVLEGVGEPVVDLALDPAGTLAAVLSLDHRAHVWDLDEERELASFALIDWPLAVAFEPVQDGQPARIALANRRGYRRAWELSGRREVEPQPVFALPGGEPVRSPDGRFAVAIEEERGVRAYDARTGALLAELPARAGRPREVAFTADGGHLAIAAGISLVLVFETATWSVAAELATYEQATSYVAFSPDGRFLATAPFRAYGLRNPRAPAASEGALIVWDWRAGQRWLSIEPASRISSVAFDPRARHVVVGHADGTLRRHALAPLEEAERLRRRPLWSFERARFGLDDTGFEDSALEDSALEDEATGAPR